MTSTVWKAPPRWRVEETPIFFLHVPKTAGTAVRHFIESVFHPHEIRRIEDVQDATREHSLSPLPGQARFVSGHVPYWFRDAFPVRPHTLLFLRHPVDRALSTYRFWRSLPAPHPDDTTGAAALLRAVENTSLEEFVNNRDGIWWGAISNYACWMVGHTHAWDLEAPWNPLIPPLALRRLETIEMLGVTERMQDSMTLIAEHLGIPLTRAIPELNVSRSAIATLPPSIVRALEDANQHDMALWEKANSEISRRLKHVHESSPAKAIIAPLLSSRFYPASNSDGPIFIPGEHPLLGEGWLPPEGDDSLSWRFATAPGPSTIHLQWPIGDSAYALAIESPFAAEGFDYGDLQILIDGVELKFQHAAFDRHTVIVTEPVRHRGRPSGTILFSHSYDRTPTHADGDARSFAVSAIRWLPCPDDGWPVTSEMARVCAQANELAIARRAGLAQLEDIIAKKDRYIASLLEALHEKDEYITSLQSAQSSVGTSTC
ncbi:MAG: sulfotransferase family 2 domain-containing protein [Hyphomonadaceae bacterium]|nr:sulfotransferase family 2 domain-containing protein [Hyphomonadaceae bacterium]